MIDEDKKELLGTLMLHMDEAIRRIREKFSARECETKIIRKDYVAQVAVLEFSNVQMTPEETDALGIELRAEWPEMPSLTATLFRLSDKNSKLILDFNAPSGIAQLAEQGEISKLVAVAQKDTTVPIMSYDLTNNPIQRADKLLKITPDAF
jgi:hypothetical protein